MRWSMVPVSAIVHGVLLGALIFFPFGDSELPAPWPLSHIPSYVAAAALPPVPRVAAAPTPNPDFARAPIVEPDGISREPEVLPPPEGPVSDFGLTAIGEGVIPGGVPGTSVGSLPSAPTPPPPPQPPAPALVRVGGVIREPRRVSGGPPIYPEIARAARVQGVVTLEAIIDETGRVTSPRVVHSIPLLDPAALAAVAQWRYTPTLLNGVPVRVLMTITFNFQLGDRTP